MLQGIARAETWAECSASVCYGKPICAMEQAPAAAKSALTGLKAAIGLIDDVDPALPAHQTIVAVPAAQGFQGITDFHDDLRLLFCGVHTQPTPSCQREPCDGCAHPPTLQSLPSLQPILTTHPGSLPRPDDLIRMMYAQEEGVPVDPEALAARVKAAVAEIVRKQADARIDLINDGEMSKPSYATYIKDRLAGFGGPGNTF